MVSSNLIKNLAQKIRALEASPGTLAAQPVCDEDQYADISICHTLFPRVGAGALFEMIASIEGAGITSLALFLAQQLSGPRALVVVDPEQVFYPPAALRLGIDLERTILLRPRRRPLAYAAMNRALRCPAVGAVIGWCDSMRAAQYQRLRIAAAEGGGIGLLLRPAGVLRERSFATFRLRLAPLVSTQRSRRVLVQLLRAPGDLFGRSFVLEVDDEKGHVRFPAELASAKDSAPRARLAR